MREKTYVLPKAVLPRVLKALETIKNLDVRSAANALIHFIGRYHTGPKVIGRHFVLPREVLADHPELRDHSEWHIRLATTELQNLKIIRKVEEAEKAQRRVDGTFRKAPTWFALERLWTLLFPAALKPRPSGTDRSPECGLSSRDSNQSQPHPERVVHSGERVEEAEPVEKAPLIEPTSSLSQKIAELGAAVVARATGRGPERQSEPRKPVEPKRDRQDPFDPNVILARHKAQEAARREQVQEVCPGKPETETFIDRMAREAREAYLGSFAGGGEILR